MNFKPGDKVKMKENFDRFRSLFNEEEIYEVENVCGYAVRMTTGYWQYAYQLVMVEQYVKPMMRVVR